MYTHAPDTTQAFLVTGFEYCDIETMADTVGG